MNRWDVYKCPIIVQRDELSEAYPMQSCTCSRWYLQLVSSLS